MWCAVRVWCRVGNEQARRGQFARPEPKSQAETDEQVEARDCRPDAGQWAAGRGKQYLSAGRAS